MTTAKQTNITGDELIELFYSLRAPYRKNAVWVMIDSTVKLIRKLKDTTGQYLWQPALTAGNPDTILGRPVYTSTFASEIKAGARTIAFGDLSYYWIADRQGRAFQRLNELYAVNGQIGFRATQRVDSKLILPEAVKVLTHNEDDALIAHVVGATTSYAASFQHHSPNHYEAHGMSWATRQAIIMLATHFYESRDGSTAGFWNTQPAATSGVWQAVHNLLWLDKNWQI